MKIAVIGAGGVGGYFGARLARSHDVQFLARGRHLAAMRAHGLHIASEVETFTLQPVQATDDPQGLAGADVVLVTTKLWDLEATGRQLAGVVGPQTVVVPFQNGVDAVDLLAASLPRERIAAGVAYISAVIREPGVIAHTGTMARLRIGALHPSQQPVLEALSAACAGAGFAADVVPDAQRMLWEKFIALNALSAVTAITRQPVGAIRADADMRALLQAVLEEGDALARASGVSLPEGFGTAQLQMLDQLPAPMRASMAHDLLAGHRLEAPWLCGAVARRAAALGVPAPVNRTIWSALKPYVDGSKA